jgi:hypothetical protein
MGQLAEKDLVEASKKWKVVEREATEMQAGIEKGEAELDSMKVKLSKLSWNEEQEKEAESKMISLKQNVRELKDVRISVFFL